MRRISLLLALCVLLTQGTLYGISLAMAEAENVETTENSEAVNDYYVTSFVISAYYSPLPGQNRYATGSYEGDIRLNGNGTNGADGTPVYPGMVAAPRTYAFGTKLDIPGIGLTTVHDRGGAIVAANADNSRGYAHDRLDVWMGYGDEGLNRALNWGKRTVDNVKVYGVRSDMNDNTVLENFSTAQQFYQATVSQPLEFTKDIYFGSDGEEVQKMQNYLVEWGYLNSATGFYGEETATALFEFQTDFVDGVDSPDDAGAGHFGTQTRKSFERFIHGDDKDREEIKIRQGARLMKAHPDLFEEPTYLTRNIGTGAQGDDVTELQKLLADLGYLRLSATGTYSEVTAHAVFKFQESQGIVTSETDSGAGYLGPKTRSTLNVILQNRYEAKSKMAYERNQIQTGRHDLAQPIVELTGILPKEQKSL